MRALGHLFALGDSGCSDTRGLNGVCLHFDVNARHAPRELVPRTLELLLRRIAPYEIPREWEEYVQSVTRGVLRSEVCQKAGDTRVHILK